MGKDDMDRAFDVTRDYHVPPGNLEKYTPRSFADPIRYYEKSDGEDPGFYFFEETWCDCHGPYVLLEDCEKALGEYAKNL